MAENFKFSNKEESQSTGDEATNYRVNSKGNKKKTSSKSIKSKQ
jgi:hypothetical protein